MGFTQPMALTAFDQPKPLSISILCGFCQTIKIQSMGLISLVTTSLNKLLHGN